MIVAFLRFLPHLACHSSLPDGLGVSKAQKEKPNKRSTERVSSPVRRASILEAATRIFIQNGYAGARTKDIAIEADINEALIYRHFASKEELFDAAVMEPLEQWLKVYRHTGRMVATATDSDTQLKLLERGAEQYLSQINDVLPLLSIALFGSGAYGAEFYTKRLVPLIEQWAKRTEIAMPDDAVGGRLDQRFLASAGFGVMFFVAADAHFRGVPFDAKTSGKHLAQMMAPLFEHRAVLPNPKPD